MKYARPVPLELLSAGDPRLLIPALRVQEFGRPLFDLVVAMRDAMWRYEGCGLAAPQVNRSLRVIVFDGLEANNKLQHMVNPSWAPIGKSKIEMLEACLSVTGEHVVSRFADISVLYQTVTGSRASILLSGRDARVIQHECDHLDGKLIC